MAGRRGKRSKADILRAEENAKYEFEIIEKTITMDGKKITFPVKVYLPKEKEEELLEVRSTATIL